MLRLFVLARGVGWLLTRQITAVVGSVVPVEDVGDLVDPEGKLAGGRGVAGEDDVAEVGAVSSVSGGMVV